MSPRALAGLAVASLALSAAPPQQTARQLFYAEDPPAPPKQIKRETKKSSSRKDKAPAENKAAAPAESVSGAQPVVVSAAYGAGSAKPLGLRYSLLQVAEGSAAEVSPDKVFRSGDQVRLHVEGNQDGYLYVISRGSSGTWKPLFPAAEISGGDNRIRARQSVDLPPAGHAFTFDEQPGEEQLFVVYSRQPVKDLDELIYSLRQGERPAADPPARQPLLVTQNVRPISDGLVSQFRTTYARDLIIEKVDSTQPAPDRKPENAVYVASSSGSRLVADIRLTHR